MTEKKVYTGYWFLPNNPSHKVAGTLHYLPNEKINLELLGSLVEGIHPIDIFNDDKVENIIHGVTSCGKKISLLNCYSFGSLNFGALTPVVKYNCRYLLEGYLLLDKNEKAFNSIRLHLPILDKWFQPEAIKQILKFDEQKRDIEEIQVHLSKRNPKNINVCIDDTYSIDLEGDFGYQEKNSDITELLITQQTICEISYHDTKTDILTLFNKALQFNLFLNLATLSTTNFTSLLLVDNDNFQDIGNGQKHLNSIKLFYVEKAEEQDTARHSYLFDYEDIKELYPQLIESWFTLETEYLPIRNYLLESIEKKRIWKSSDFLIIVQALEGYHRRFVNNNQNIKLRPRIEDLCRRFSEIESLNISTSDIRNTVKSRNYYSHFYEDKEHVLEGLELYTLAKKLRVLLICCTLSFLGFTNEKINELIKDSYNDILK